jgi:hypothetical protein
MFRTLVLIAGGPGHQALFCLLLALGSAVMLEAEVLPQSSCTEVSAIDPTQGFNCNLYPSDANGNFSGDVIIPFPSGWNSTDDPLTPGWVVLDTVPANIDPVTGADTNMSDWAQVLDFVDPTNSGASATYMELFTVGCNSATDPSDMSCFPSVATVTTNPNIGYDFETEPANGIFVYNPCPSCPAEHIYTVNFEASPVPEPSTFAIAFGGIAVLASCRQRRR